MLTFEPEQVTSQIEPLPRRLRVAFAAACAQRQVPNYVHTFAANPTGDADAITRILRELWDSAERNAFEHEKLEHDLAICDEILAHYENTPIKNNEYPADAVASLTYALDTALSRGSQETMWAAQRACSALFHYLGRRFDLDPGMRSVLSYINYIDSFPIMQAEMSRQQADIAELHAAAKDAGTEAAVIARIKRRAEGDATSFFGKSSKGR